MNNTRSEQGNVMRGVGARPGIRSVMALAIAVAACGVAWAQPAVEYGKTAATAAAPVKAAPAKAPAAAVKTTAAAPAVEQRGAMPVCSGDMPAPIAVDVVVGKSTLIKLPGAITLRTLADKDIAQARLLSPTTLYILGTNIGSTNMILQDGSGRCTLVDLNVGMDGGPLRSKLAQLMPDEKNITVTPAADTLVLSGVVADATRVEYAMNVATAYVRYTQSTDTQRQQSGHGASGGLVGGLSGMETRVINMLSVASPQQVMLEVKVAEVSKQIAEKLGAQMNLFRTNGDWTYGILSQFLSGAAGGALGSKGFIPGFPPEPLSNALPPITGMPDLASAPVGNVNGSKLAAVDAEKKDGLIKILAEPTVMAVSGQEGSFLAGGKIFIPVGQTASDSGSVTIKLEEREFGVGLKFTPTVLAGGRIHLKVAPEVSELSREGVAVSAPNVVGRQILPLITTRRATTTVELMDGQSLVIGGLIKNNIAGNIKGLPILGELPIIGALFRSTEFQTDRSEVLFVVTPRLAKPLAGRVQLPTDAYVEPSRFDVFLGGRLEGSAPPSPEKTQPTPASDQPGFELK